MVNVIQHGIHYSISGTRIEPCKCKNMRKWQKLRHQWYIGFFVHYSHMHGMLQYFRDSDSTFVRHFRHCTCCTPKFVSIWTMHECQCVKGPCPLQHCLNFFQIRVGVALRYLLHNHYDLNIILVHGSSKHTRLLAEFFSYQYKWNCACESVSKMVAGAKMSLD